MLRTWQCDWHQGNGLILPADLINPLIDEIDSIKRILTSIVKSIG